MKNTTFRKKALLSSVAMLLVALVALGSATFAWFAANPNAEATGLSMKTTASTGLVLRTDSDPVWDHDAILNAKATTTGEGINAVTTYAANTDIFDLQPASQNKENGSLWTIGAESADSHVAKTQDDEGNAIEMTNPSVGGWSKRVDDNGTYNASGSVYKENIYFRLSDGSAADDTKKVYITGATITKATNATMENAIRVAVANSTGEVIATYGIVGDTNAPQLTGKDATSGTYVLSQAGVATSIECASTLTANAANFEDFVTVYVYLDGEHEDCKSDMVGTVNAEQIISEISLSFTLK